MGPVTSVFTAKPSTSVGIAPSTTEVESARNTRIHGAPSQIHLWATPGALNLEPVAQWLVQNVKDLESVFVGQGIHFIREDQPEIIGRAIADWMRGRIR